MACKMTDFQWHQLDVFSRLCGQSAAEWVEHCGGPFAHGREAAIAAFTRGYDQAAARLTQPDDENPELIDEAFERVTETNGLAATRHFMWLGQEADDD